MESSLLTRVFRRLLSHQTCSKLRYHTPSTEAISNTPRPRYFSGSSKEDNGLDNDLDDFDAKRESDWQQRTDILPPDKMKAFEKYPMVTSEQLRSRRERPKRVKMLARDFIEDSLYNPNYGYFPKNVTIFSPGLPFDFKALRNEEAFHAELGNRYTNFEDELDRGDPNESRQLWHTPTELFRPHYGEAIARYLVTNYKLRHHPLHDLTIYELGAGNGTLMLNVLDYIRSYHPDIYPRTRFKIIEISSALATFQTSQLHRNASSRGHASHVEIINKSIFDWNILVSKPCYVLALEVFDNFAHDAIRYDPFTEQPLQGTILVDAAGDFYEFYVPRIDPLASGFLNVRAAACTRRYNHPLRGSRSIRRLKASLPFAGNLTLPEYIPTRLLSFFNILADYFPHHQLLTSDFNALPDAVKGYNAPVVQTRYQRRTVAVTTPYVMQGYFDILFPTDFTVVEDVYRAVTGRLTRVMGQKQFLEGWGDIEATTTISGENPMLAW